MNQSNTWGAVPEHLHRARSQDTESLCRNAQVRPQSEPAPGWGDRLPAFLRGLGASAVLLSLYSFLMRGWEGGDDLIRYLLLFGHTLALVAIALGCGRWLHEGKSPRLLMMLALASVPINFAILGAFLYAGTHSLGGIDYPSFVTWSVASLGTALALTVLACIGLLPVIWLAFRTLARGLSLRLSGLFMLANLALLIPLREPLPVVLLGTALALYTLVISARTTQQHSEARTREGTIALMLPFLPVAILLGRNILLYPYHDLMLAGIGATLFMVLRHLSQSLPFRHWARRLLELLSLPIALFSGFALSSALAHGQSLLSLPLLLGPLLAAAMLYELAQRACSGQGLYRCMAMLMLLGGLLFNLLCSSTLIASLICIGAGLALVIYSHLVQQRVLLSGGLILLLAGLTDQLMHALDYFDFSYWIGLALVGVSAIVLASLLEARGTELRQALARYRKQQSEWTL